MAFGVAALAVVALMFGLATAIASARETLVERLRDGAPRVKRWGGRVLVTVGLWLVALGVFSAFFADVFPGG